MPNRPEFFLATMSNSFFRFKQFTIHHDRCAMKVGTDGVLLGAWTDVGHSKDILDVGTGTGLIALMVAQRNPAAAIWAIDIDPGAVAQAKGNVANSSFADRMTVEQCDFRHCASQRPNRFDLIVSIHHGLKIPSCRPMQEEPGRDIRFRSRWRNCCTLLPHV